jgi:hypothetical protein
VLVGCRAARRLRGFVLCGDCKSARTACWSKGKLQRHPHDLWRNRACESYRKSIPREGTEGRFEMLLDQLQPTEELFRIADPEKEKLLMREKLTSGGKPQRPFDEMFEHATAFLATSWKIWDSGRLDDKRRVLKLAFADRLAYRRNQEARTPSNAMFSHS